MHIKINMLEATAARKATPIASPSKEEVARSKELASKLVAKFASAAKRAKVNVTELTSNSYPSLERAGFYVHHITGKLGQVTFIATVAQKGASNYYETVKAEGRLATGGYSALPKAKAKGTAAEIIEPIFAAAATRDRRGTPRDSTGGGNLNASSRKQSSSFLSVEAEVMRLQKERDDLVKQYDLKIQKLLDSRNPLKQK